MWIDFDVLPEDSRIWIYQSDRHLEEDLSLQIIADIKSFIHQWEAHSKPLKGSAKIVHNRFLIVGLDESFNPVTGCSTDASVHAVKEIGTKYGIDFFNRTQLPFLIGNNIEILPLDKIKRKEIPADVSVETMTFNNLVNVKRDLESDWKQPVGNTWLAKYVS